MPLEAKADALIGTVLEGRFQIERLLGEGGMGRVYVADETRLRRRCALKVLLPELTQDKECVERFLREAQAIAQIHHENVVDIYHLGEDLTLGVVFFAMELLAGEDLETRLLDRQKRPLSWQQICQWMAQTAGAMAAVHATGMIHRDLKPSNIFITRRRDGRDQIKLLDFGIAKVAHHAALTSTGAAIGTPYYMSPEQILAQSLDSRTDIYSLGVLFYEAIAGRMPFVGEPIQVAMQHCNVTPQPISVVSPDVDVPPDLEELILRMLAKDRDDRPQTMEEIEAFLLDLSPPTSVHASGMHRPLTGPIPPASSGGGRVTPTEGAAAMATARTQAFQPGSTPARGLPQVAPDARTTHQDPPRRPATTVEITLDTEPRTPARRKWTPVLLGAVVLGLGITVVSLLGRGDDPAPQPPPVDPAPQLVAPPQPQPPPETKPPEPPPEPPPDPTGKPPVDPPPEPPPEDPKTPKKGTDTPKGEGTRDPFAQIKKAAAQCRKQHKAPKEPKITIDYAIGSDGAVTRSVPPADSGELGKCLADAVRRTKFPPKLALGQKLPL